MFSYGIKTGNSFREKFIFAFLRIMTSHMYESKQIFIYTKENKCMHVPSDLFPSSFLCKPRVLVSTQEQMTHLVMPYHMSKRMENMCLELMNDD